jgi:hypothetical protein
VLYQVAYLDHPTIGEPEEIPDREAEVAVARVAAVDVA